MMVVEITAGVLSHSMALLADGWHMSTHVTAFLITAIAYYFTRRHSSDEQYSFGTGKIGVLGGFASAVVLSVVALLMAGESVHRLFVPLTIHFNEAIGIACVALTVNVVCALLLKEDHHHSAHDYRGQDRHHRDLNLRAAYLHVLADAFTTFLAIIALTSGKFFGWGWLDPIVGFIGSGVVFSWAYQLLRDTSGILLDRKLLNGEITFWQVVAAYAFALGGGSISALLRLTHKPLCALISFAAGTLLGVTLFAILPESLTSSGLWPVGLAAATGYALFFFVSKYVHHVCPACAASHFDADATRHFGEIASALVVALAIHSTTDGVALGIGPETAVS